MSYHIESGPLTGFLDNTAIKLPRFQRKASWDSDQCFELCISVFQDYPVGVVTLNNEKDVSWLLDGRQRRTALKEMRENPISIYEWGMSYIGAKKTYDAEQITKAYWDKVETFLLSEEQKSNRSEEKETNEQQYEGEEEIVESSFNSEKQRDGLKLLLKIILMVHKNTSTGSRWERTFKYSDYCIGVKYQLKRENYKVNPKVLRTFLLDYVKCINENSREITEETFIEYIDDACSVKEESRKKFEKEIKRNWEYIKESVDIISKSEKIFTGAQIGYIQLTNVSPLDAQIIFSRVNDGGTKLKAEELLSAKPYWNEEIEISDDDVKTSVNQLYKKIGVDIPKTIVKWDIAATFLSRIDKQHLVFELSESNKVSLNDISLGFKLISSWYVGGMSSVCVNDLEKKNEINWDTDIAEFASNINDVCKLLLDDSFFEFFKLWKRPISKLLGNAIALEFITIILKDWIDKGRPSSGGSCKAFVRDAKILLDRLIFEYVTKAWRGSGDSKMMNDIKEWKNRIAQSVSETEWQNFIKGALIGKYNGQKTSYELLSPILYYYYSLKCISPNDAGKAKFDVDHIIPQEKFVDNPMVNQYLKDSLGNLALLPKKDNIAKNNKTLEELLLLQSKDSSFP